MVTLAIKEMTPNTRSQIDRLGVWSARVQYGTRRPRLPEMRTWDDHVSSTTPTRTLSQPAISIAVIPPVRVLGVNIDVAVLP
jgi:hypothetical protein